MSSSRGRGKRKLLGDGGNGFEEWGGYMQAKIQKLQDQFQEEMPEEGPRGGQFSNIFTNVAIFVNGYTRPPSSELKMLMKQHGGAYHNYYQRSVVTHIIASNLPDSKVYKLTDRVVKAEWITDSIKAKKLLSDEPYLLYTARGKFQPGLDTFAVKTGVDKQTAESVSYVPTDNSTMRGTVLKKVCTPADVSSEMTFNSNLDNSPLNTQSDKNLTDTSAADIYSKTVAVQVRDQTAQKCIPRNQPVEKPQNNDGGYRAIGDARDPKFIAEFYNNSRLHHIATWGAEYKALVTRLQTEGDMSFPGRAQLRDIVARRPSDTPVNTGRPSRVIMHVDMDCFFVSVGLRKRPDLIGKPVAVTHSRGKGAKTERPGTNLPYEAAHYSKRGLKLRKGPGRGTVDPNLGPVQNLDLLQIEALADEGFVDEEGEGSVTEDSPVTTTATNTTPQTCHSMAEIASCNYEARKAGVRNGMFMGTAKSMCPDIQTIPYDFDGYREVSQLLYGIVASFTHDIEAVSCDEMLVDCSDLLADTGATSGEFATFLRQLIREKTQCNASAGLGPNILLARMATHMAKPNGQFLLEEEAAADFMKDKSVADLPGVGRAMVNKLSALKITTCSELQRLTLGALQREVGMKTGQALYRFSRGEDSRPIKSEQERKSVSAEVNYGIRFTNEGDVSQFVGELSGEVHSRLAKINVKGKTITLKLKVRAEGAPKETAKFMGHGICDNVTKSTTIPIATDSADVITKEVMGIIHALRIPPSEYRGVGIQMSRLEAPIQRKSLSRGLQSILSFSTKTTETATTKSTTPATNNTQLTSSKSTAPATINNSIGTTSPSTLPKAIGLKTATDPFTTAGPITTGPTASASRVNPADTTTLLTSQINPLVTSCPQPSTDEPGQTEGANRLGDYRPPAPNIRVKIRLPPLPTLPDFRSPPNQPVPSTGDLFLPSPSQVDMDVLKELPADIRQQIESEMAAWRTENRARVVTTRSRDAAALTSLAATHHPPQNNEPIVALPSPSQLDPSCLEALPAELRAELAQAYKHEKRRAHSTRNVPATVTQLHPLMQPKNQHSPKGPSPKKHSPKGPSPKKHSPKGPSPKKHSPSGASRGSPQFKRPRGRGPGKSGPGRSRKALDFGKTSSSVQKSVITPPAHASSSVVSVSAPSTSGNAGSAEHMPTAPSHPSPERVNLCGAVTLAEVKDLLSQWSASCDVPEAKDLGHVTRYLYDLVEDHDLERVGLVLKYFRRCVWRRQLSTEWDEAYRDVLAQAQAIVQSTYGSRLKM